MARRPDASADQTQHRNDPGSLLHCMSPVMADFVAKVFLHWRSKILLAVDATFV
jgi:hypothetical protein